MSLRTIQRLESANKEPKGHTLRILEGYGHTFGKKDTIAKIGIGTIGSDFITNRITTIDFKNQKIQLYNDRPEWMEA